MRILGLILGTIALAVLIVFLMPKDKDAIRIEEVKTFATRLAMVMQKNFQSLEQEPGVRQTIVITVDSTDIVKTDSTIHPLMAKVVLKNDHTIKHSDGDDVMTSTFDLRFIKTNGKFVLDKGVYHGVQSTDDLPTNWYADNIALAQK